MTRAAPSKDTPRVCNFPAGAPFADWLAAFVLERHGSDPMVLADTVVLLPTRRAVRATQDAFLRARDGRPTLLPQLRALGDVDEEESGLAPYWPAQDSALPPAIAPLERQLILARLVQARGGGMPAGTAMRLGQALAELLDEAAIEECDLDRLETLVPEGLAAHWQEILDFLEIVRTAWPAILAERGQTDPMVRRIAALRRLAAAWTANPPQGPVYAAGSTGSIPATADLLACIARLPRGAVILPGLDRNCPAAEWEAIAQAPTHPQHMLHRLLLRIGLPRTAVRDWFPGDASAPAGLAPASMARAALARTALAPADLTDGWSAAGALPAAAFEGLRRLEAATAGEEAAAIALLMRQSLERPGRTAALVTPDRALAVRVAAALERWGLTVDDSAGQPLSRTPPAGLLRLAAAMVEAELAPVPLLAVLKHPLVRLGRPRAEHLRLTRLLERNVLRGVRPPPGMAGLRTALARSTADADAGLQAWLDDLAAAVALAEAASGATTPAGHLLDAHLALAEALAAEEPDALAAAAAQAPEPAPSPLWAGEAGNALAARLAELRGGIDLLPPMGAGEWSDFLDAVLQGVVVRPAFGLHPRLFIWGPLEARLQAADTMILAGLNEGSWPAAAQEDPWMSRPMRTGFGLPAPERRIGQAAHDFVQAFAAADVVLSRAQKVDGAPSVPSRWLLRLDALLHRDPRWTGAAHGQALAWARALDLPAQVRPAPPPRPCPPVPSRPRHLSVTQVETWIRDPYAIYARFVLGLRPLDALDPDPSAPERGIVVHDVLERFVRETAEDWPADPAGLLERIGRETFGELLEIPYVATFWWPRFRRIAEWFARFEGARRADGIRPLEIETQGSLTLSGPAGPFELTARADRIDLTPQGLEILDYKTGQPPSAEQVASGLSPQLPLEGAIAQAGGFPAAAGKPVAGFTYVRLSGGREAGRALAVGGDDPAALAAAALAGLHRRIARYDRPDTPYLSRPNPQWLKYPGDYDHLARAREWQAGEEGE